MERLWSWLQVIRYDMTHTRVNKANAAIANPVNFNMLVLVCGFISVQNLFQSLFCFFFTI